MNYSLILYSVLAAILALVLMYLDTKILDNPKTKSTYVKGMIMTGLITGLIIYFIGSDGLSSSTQYMPALNEEILTGPPNF